MDHKSLLVLAASTMAVGAAANSAAIAAANLGTEMRQLPAPARRGSKRSRSRPQKPEELFAALIKMGKVRIVRRKGQPPLIQWL